MGDGGSMVGSLEWRDGKVEREGKSFPSRQV